MVSSKETLKCPKCGAEVNIRNPSEGKIVTCKKCGTLCEVIKKRRKFDLIPIESEEGGQDISDMEFEINLD